MIRASRALPTITTCSVKFDANVNVPVPDERIREIWQQEHDSGGFAVNGEMSEEHWTAQMVLYRELYPELRMFRRMKFCPRFCGGCLEALGATGGFDKPDQIPAVAHPVR